MAKTLLFIDTNILLDFYRAPQSDLSLEVFDSLLKHPDHLIISDQVRIEFLRNRNQTIQNYLERLPKKVEENSIAPVLLSRTKEAKELKQCANNLQCKLVILKKKLNDIWHNPKDNDMAYKKIMPLFDIDNPFNINKQPQELVDKIFFNAIKRFYQELPPRKKKDISIGDAFNWEWCLHCCSGSKPKHNLIILSRDKDFSDPENVNKIHPSLKSEFAERVGKSFSVRLEKKLNKALNDIKLEISKDVEEELDKIQKASEEYEYAFNEGQCNRCGAPAMFDAYCKKCDTLVLGDAEGEDYIIRRGKIYETDINDQNNLVHCPNCGSTKMEIEYGDYCGYCQYMADKAFDDD
jgi:predicted nucleic acid-binding protein